MKTKDKTTRDMIARVIRENRRIYIHLKETCRFNGGTIASYAEILASGRGSVNPLLGVAIGLFLTLIFIIYI